jgi:hypothetical protein
MPRLAAPTPGAPPVQDAVAVLDASQEAVLEIEHAEAGYHQTARQLDELVAKERPRWRREVAARFDARLAELETAIAERHLAFGASPMDVRALDALIASERQRNAYVQEALLHEGVGGDWL